MNAPNLLSVSEALRQMRAGTISAHEILYACLDQAERLNPKLNAFITLAPAVQLSAIHSQEGMALESRTATEGTRTSMLAGIPIAVKDLYDTANLPTTGGSLFFNHNIPADDATVIQRLRVAGAVIMGKTNTHEIALGVTTQNPHFGSCRNPWDESRIPGGSSGGSAVAVATGMALAGLGTDTGGSIRIPASLCGVVGLKPTYGRVSLRGILPLSWNLDHAGPLTSCVEDAARMLQVMAGYDAADPTSVDRHADDYGGGLGRGIKGWRIGLGVGEYVAAASREVLEAVRRGATILAKEGAIIEEVDLSFLREGALANGLMTQADAAAYHRDRLKEHPDWFGEDVRKRLEAGRSLSSTDYSLARRTQAEIKRKLDGLWESYEILILPTTPAVASLIEGDEAIEAARRLTRFTAPFNLAGVPAISLPCGLSAEGLPIGMQMVAGPWQEARILQAALAYEDASGNRGLRPPMATAQDAGPGPD